MSWEEALRYASGPGVNAVVGALLSLLAEYWPWYGELGSRWKRAVMFALCLAVPAAAAALGVATAGWDLSWEGTFWPALMAGLAAFAAGQGVHMRRLEG